MRIPLVAGNWKMNGSTLMATDLVNQIARQTDMLSDIEVLVCPPFTLLGQIGTCIRDTSVKLGAQDVYTEADGAFTGQISADMLLDQSCEYVIVGHSERRTLFAETDSMVAGKTAVAIGKGLIPIVCVGETQIQRDRGETDDVIHRQLDIVMQEVGVSQLTKVVIAYEPVWAIGTGLTATPEQAQAVHKRIRQQVAGADQQVADGLRILYGGSMKPDNAVELLTQEDIDGGLIGGAALVADSFVAICRAASRQY